jgi:multidrug efflux pump subunit AcrA (membrane-fusion protein)
MQAELSSADRLLRDSFADLTESLSILILYVGPDGFHTVDAADEVPDETSPFELAATMRQAIVESHRAFVPITTATGTVAVIRLLRNAHQPPFDPVAVMLMAAIARESVPIIHHLFTLHHQHILEQEQDKKSLYRPEALAAYRTRGQEGVVTELSPSWVRATYYVVLVTIVIVYMYATLKHLPTYSTGKGVVVFDGTPITAPAGGTIEAVYVRGGQSVAAGDPLVKLASEAENAALRQATAELETAVQQYLFDRTDESVRKSMASAVAAVNRARDTVDQRTVRAKTAGTVSDVRIRPGTAIEQGAPILTILAPNAQPEVWAYLPGSDRPRFRRGMALQVELLGNYQKARDIALIYEVGRDVIGGSEVQRTLGKEFADSLQLQTGQSYVVVKAKLKSRTFRSKGRTYNFFPGMPAKTEIVIEDKRVLSLIFPSAEKYLP